MKTFLWFPIQLLFRWGQYGMIRAAPQPTNSGGLPNLENLIPPGIFLTQSPPELGDLGGGSAAQSLFRLSEDGLTQWHPAFLALGKTLNLCAEAYRKFCKRYQPKPKTERRNHWGSKLLEQIKARSRLKKKTPGQKSLWENWETPAAEIRKVAKKFVLANCYDPKVAGLKFDSLPSDPQNPQPPPDRLIARYRIAEKEVFAMD